MELKEAHCISISNINYKIVCNRSSNPFVTVSFDIIALLGFSFKSICIAHIKNAENKAYCQSNMHVCVVTTSYSRRVKRCLCMDLYIDCTVVCCSWRNTPVGIFWIDYSKSRIVYKKELTTQLYCISINSGSFILLINTYEWYISCRRYCHKMRPSHTVMLGSCPIRTPLYIHRLQRMIIKSCAYSYSTNR